MSAADPDRAVQHAVNSARLEGHRFTSQFVELLHQVAVGEVAADDAIARVLLPHENDAAARITRPNFRTFLERYER